MLLNYDWIAAHIPHQGSMCLLDSVNSWDAQQARCLANNHRDANNPLRAHGRLSSACGIEYAAQVMAVHGALLAPEQALPRLGYLASVRGVKLHVPRLDDIEEPLVIDVKRFSGDGNNILYDFIVYGGVRALLEGRATVVTNAERIAPF
jgi:predicted hotdog family 3-hydroxylacyl-ACP dehydratase